MAKESDFEQLFWLVNQPKEYPADTICNNCNLALNYPRNKDTAKRIIQLMTKIIDL
jgi:hypothetical protein